MRQDHDDAHADTDSDRESTEKWYERKSAFMASRLGPQHDTVMHALIPFALGGGLDLYYYPNGIPGTCISTKELCEIPGEGPSNRVFSCYELVMFTRVPLALDDAKNPATPFGRIHAIINDVLNPIAQYCGSSVILNPCESCEFPADMDGVGGMCLLFDGYGCWPDKEAGEFGLMLLMAIHRSELEFIQKNGSERLLERLKGAGVYPYSDLDRPPVA